jgi:hypothetical protein
VDYTFIYLLFGVNQGWRYPGSEEEYQRRKDAGEKIAWLK